MHRMSLLVFCSLLLMATSVWGEFYKYTDSDGNVHFTDDYNQVPMDQRENVEGYTEYEREDMADPVDAPNTTAEKDASGPAMKTDTGGSALDARMQELDRRKMALAREYDALIRENQRLAEMKKNIQTTEEAAQYNEQVKQLNAKIRAHDQKRQQWFKDVEAYNAQVAAQTQE